MTTPVDDIRQQLGELRDAVGRFAQAGLPTAAPGAAPASPSQALLDPVKTPLERLADSLDRVAQEMHRASAQAPAQARPPVGPSARTPPPGPGRLAAVAEIAGSTQARTDEGKEEEAKPERGGGVFGWLDDKIKAYKAGRDQVRRSGGVIPDMIAWVAERKRAAQKAAQKATEEPAAEDSVPPAPREPRPVPHRSAPDIPFGGLNPRGRLYRRQPQASPPPPDPESEVQLGALFHQLPPVPAEARVPRYPPGVGPDIPQPATAAPGAGEGMMDVLERVADTLESIEEKIGEQKQGGEAPLPSGGPERRRHASLFDTPMSPPVPTPRTGFWPQPDEAPHARPPKE